MCMPTNFGAKKDKSYRIRKKSRNKKEDVFSVFDDEFEDKKEFDFEKLSKPNPNFIDERKR